MDYQSLFDSCVERFNHRFGASIHPQLYLITMDQREETAAKLRKQLGVKPVAVESDYAAQAIIGLDGDRITGEAAIIFVTDSREPDPEFIMLHELGHVFAITQEYGGRDFKSLHGGDALGGYLIWMEFIPDYLAWMVRGEKADPFHTLSVNRNTASMLLNDPYKHHIIRYLTEVLIAPRRGNLVEAMRHTCRAPSMPSDEMKHLWET